MKKSVNVQIPRDPRVEGIAFITDMPSILTDRLDEYRWHEIMSGLNNLFHESESPSFISLIRTLLVVPLLFGGSRNIFKKVEQYIRDANGFLKNYGVCIMHPGYNQYIELELEVCQDW